MVACEKMDHLQRGLTGTLKCLKWLKAVSSEVDSYDWFRMSDIKGIPVETSYMNWFFKYFKEFAEPLLIAILPEKSYSVDYPDGRWDYLTAHSAVVDQTRRVFKAVQPPGPLVLILNPDADREQALRDSVKLALAIRNNWDSIETSLRVEYERAMLDLGKYSLGDAGRDVAHQFTRKNETRDNVSRDRDEVQLSHTPQTNRDQFIYQLHLDPKRTWKEIAELTNRELNRDKNKDNRDQVCLSSDAVKKIVERLVKGNPAKYEKVPRKQKGRPNKKSGT